MSGEITLGTDPELIFVGPQGIVSANKYLPRQAGHDGNNPEIGADGHPWIAELRSRPGKTPVEVVKDIKEILRRNYKIIPAEVCWRAGSWVENKPIGGHIHFGGVFREDRLVSALDGILAQFIVLLEDEDGAKKRRSGQHQFSHYGYGKLGDTRNKKWGFEYRPLPSWIISPQISLGVLALAKAIVYEEMDDAPNSIRLLKGDELTAVVRINNRHFLNCKKDYFYDKLETIYKIIRRYRYWKTDEGKSLWVNVALLKHIAEKYPDWHNDKDILHRWKIRNATPESYKIVRSEAKPIVQIDEKIQAQHVWQRMMDVPIEMAAGEG